MVKDILRNQATDFNSMQQDKQLSKQIDGNTRGILTYVRGIIHFGGDLDEACQG